MKVIYHNSTRWWGETVVIFLANGEGTIEVQLEKQPSAKELCDQLMQQFTALEEKNRALLIKKQTLEEESKQVLQQLSISAFCSI